MRDQIDCLFRRVRALKNSIHEWEKNESSTKQLVKAIEELLHVPPKEPLRNTQAGRATTSSEGSREPPPKVSESANISQPRAPEKSSKPTKPKRSTDPSKVPERKTGASRVKNNQSRRDEVSRRQDDRTSRQKKSSGKF